MLDIVFIFGAKYLYLVIALIAAVFFLKQPHDVQKRIFIFTLISLPIIFIISRIVSLFYYDPRPFVVEKFTPLIPHAADNGFPSDHTLLAATISAIIFLYNRKLGAILWILTFIVAISRVYVGVHHFVDVLASILVVLAVVLLLKLLLLKTRGNSII